MDLVTDVFHPVAKRIRERAESLRNIKIYSRSGIEGWLKVEVVAALGNKVVAVQNKGPDLLLNENLQIELKAATNLESSWIAQGATKYNSACLFIGDGDSRGIEKLASDKRITLLAHEVFSDGVSPWIIGIVIPK